MHLATKLTVVMGLLVALPTIGSGEQMVQLDLKGGG